jgi:hypothetical protein
MQNIVKFLRFLPLLIFNLCNLWLVLVLHNIINADISAPAVKNPGGILTSCGNWLEIQELRQENL